ncbi:hypothetical protein [Thalassolituus pacificus]|jgi:hypothetical protein|uniref:Uncharacterized protein n=1 Tax=Thalassolituus pacificus TaxID=2975440 RepID=A0A9X2WC86_9GAMM|nr:hypothetical protein [Thalassolituus pacificus]MCT7357644.1 hypothetical protein [Thalassolituus pacificus]
MRVYWDTFFRRLLAILTAGLLFLVPAAYAECLDRDAKAASDEKAKAYFKVAEIFHPARVLKVHHPSRRKEVASYVKTGEKHYSIFTLIDADCNARFIKRTRQGD